MNGWTILNGAAWALCALLAFLLVRDLIRVERQNRKEEKQGDACDEK